MIYLYTNREHIIEKTLKHLKYTEEENMITEKKYI